MGSSPLPTPRTEFRRVEVRRLTLLAHGAEAIADRLVSDREDALDERMGLPPHHVIDD